MEISNKTLVWLSAVLGLAIALHQYYLRQRDLPEKVGAPPALAVELSADAPPARGAIARVPTFVAGDLADPAAVSNPVVIVDPFGSPALQQRRVDEQVRRMKQYALEAGADDPFAKTPEQIEEFHKRGNPIVW